MMAQQYSLETLIKQANARKSVQVYDQRNTASLQHPEHMYPPQQFDYFEGDRDQVDEEDYDSPQNEVEFSQLENPMVMMADSPDLNPDSAYPTQ